MNYVILEDTHFGNEKLEKECRIRGFTEKVFKSMKSSIPKDGILIHLGDVCMDNEAEWNLKITELPFKQRILVRGNHDKKSNAWYMGKGWDFVCDLFMIEQFSRKILFSHVPVPNFGYDINIHGHYHDYSEEIIRTKEPGIYSILNNKHYLMSLERVNYKMIRLEDIIEDFNRGNNTIKMIGVKNEQPGLK
jgi:calcineurin-like phosphoesterase family protein